MPSAADAVGAAIDAFCRAAADDEDALLDALGALDGREDPRIVPFLLDVLDDDAALDLARIEVCELLKDRARPTVEERASIGAALVKVLREDENGDLRGHAAMALSRYPGERGVREAFEKVALDTEEEQTLRRQIVFALEAIGPLPWTERLLRQLDVDPALARAARRILGEWDPDRATDGSDGDDD